MGFNTTNNTCNPLESVVGGHWSLVNTGINIHGSLRLESTRSLSIGYVQPNPVQSPLSFQAFPKKLTSQ
ncbi:predicted protein [Sclerotinia sclerotiorum 1980 UF-70]|uniref:Uncharacterized protein n=1 Tax=Sclerotinia sclerotiorum (strain ATCC 18683 / 1980 / Ss-1) TaxID=665079 RepID=A7EAQ7_SCLS1|nr:predicted protein [Sclerotinia sclerotiorum 1980 UF-70]EDN99535.1 predicted protein [Sclerotinia sclerotiorum 1980 UF-70]